MLLSITLRLGRMMTLRSSQLGGFLLSRLLSLTLFLFYLPSNFQSSSCKLFLPLLVLDKRVKEDFVIMINTEHLKRLIDSRNGSVLFLDYLPKVTSHLRFLGFCIFIVLSRLLCLILDLIKEVNETLSIGSEHVFTSLETVLTHVSMILEPLDFSLFCLQHLLHQKHFSLLINKFVAVFLILRSLNGYCEASSFTDIDFTLDLGIDGQRARLDISLADFAETALPCGSVLLPYFK